MSGLDGIKTTVAVIFEKPTQNIPTLLDIERRDFLIAWYRRCRHMTREEMEEYRENLIQAMKYFEARAHDRSEDRP